LRLAAGAVEALRTTAREADLAGVERVPVRRLERALDLRAVAGLGVRLQRGRRGAGAARQVTGKKGVDLRLHGGAAEAEGRARMTEVVGEEERDLGVRVLRLRLPPEAHALVDREEVVGPGVVD